MKKHIKEYYESALGVLKMDDKHLDDYIKDRNNAIRIMGDEINRLELALELTQMCLDRYSPYDDSAVSHAKDKINEALKGCE